MSRSSREKCILAAGLLALLVVVSAVAWRLVGSPLMGLISDPDVFRDWVERQGWYSRLIFVGMVIFQVILAVIPGEPFEIAAGYAFGALEGTILTIAGAALGSIITFGLVRRFGMRLVRIFFSEEKINSLRFLKTSNARTYLFLVIYMIPGTPKDLLGYFAGLTDLPFPVFCLICTLGRIPSVVTSTLGGNALGTESYAAAVIVFAIALAASALGLAAYHWICRKYKAVRQAG